MKIVYCGGTFDILHPGHVKLLRWAKDTFGYVIVGLNTDRFIERYKGHPPIMNFEQRKCMLEALLPVNEVIENIGDEDSRLAIRAVAEKYAHPIAIVNGSDWTRERLMKQMSLTEEFLKEVDAEIAIFPDSDPIHSGDIKKRMR